MIEPNFQKTLKQKKNSLNFKLIQLFFDILRATAVNIFNFASRELLVTFFDCRMLANVMRQSIKVFQFNVILSKILCVAKVYEILHYIQGLTKKCQRNILRLSKILID